MVKNYEMTGNKTKMVKIKGHRGINRNRGGKTRIWHKGWNPVVLLWKGHIFGSKWPLSWEVSIASICCILRHMNWHAANNSSRDNLWQFTSLHITTLQNFSQNVGKHPLLSASVAIFASSCPSLMKISSCYSFCLFVWTCILPHEWEHSLGGSQHTKSQ